MKYEIEFHDSKITDVKTEKNFLRIFFKKAVLIVTDPVKGWIQKDFWVPCEIILTDPKYTILPQTGRLFDGQVSSLKNLVPINYKGSNDILTLVNEQGKIEIKYAMIEFVVNSSDLPSVF